MTKFYVGFLGRKGSGKDTCAAIFRDTVDLTLDMCRFAEPLKEQCEVLFPQVPRKHFHGSQACKEQDLAKYGLRGHSGRTLMQGLGDYLTGLDPRYYVTLAERNECRDADGYIYVDVRKTVEVDYIHSKGGVIVRVLGGDVSDRHHTEAGQSAINADYVIDNRDISRSELRDRIRDLAWVLLSEPPRA